MFRCLIPACGRDHRSAAPRRPNFGRTSARLHPSPDPIRPNSTNSGDRSGPTNCRPIPVQMRGWVAEPPIADPSAPARAPTVNPSLTKFIIYVDPPRPHPIAPDPLENQRPSFGGTRYLDPRARPLIPTTTLNESLGEREALLRMRMFFQVGNALALVVSSPNHHCFTRVWPMFVRNRLPFGRCRADLGKLPPEVGPFQEIFCRCW